ncbi:DNA primase [Rhodobacteraceae bacterium D3-12]|nr:DNA primase [Rhodobacteraceae bacterium D3-12]
MRTRTSLVDVVGRKVMWDTRKSNQGKGDMWAPCPFHHEKTASFHVDDRKGYYYCFGCHAKGDAISFVRETENVSFMEAIEILAGEAGLPMPARDPKAQEKADRRTELVDVMEQAVHYFRLQLKTAAAAPARDYIDGRGLKPETLEKFEIGFAPDGWQNLWDHLKNKGVEDQMILDCGLAKPSTREGSRPYDTFRNRIMFPIRDPRGRCIAFGGRAMDPNDNAKYLNSPETLLFDKSRTLYNHAPAREAAGMGQPLIVAEGYMDVIALSEAGFGATVAPLGTAVTEHQIAHLWRITDEPIIALDGDTAGLRAAMRVIDIALPLLEAGKSLRFALMPEGKDPDDVIRAEGAGAIQTLLDTAQPMVTLLWQRETEGRVYDSPERKAALDKALREKIKLIQDPSVRQHYGQAIKDLRWQLFNPRRPSTWKPWKPGQKPGQTPQVETSTRHSALAGQSVRSLLSAADEDQLDHLRISVILAVLMAHPGLLHMFESDLYALDTPDATLARIRDVLIQAAAERSEEELASFSPDIDPSDIEKLLSQPHLRVVSALNKPDDTEIATQTLREEIAKLKARRARRAEVMEAESDIGQVADETLTWRLGQAAEARNAAEHGGQDDKTQYDTGANGARINREERDAFEQLLSKIGHPKPPG